MNKLLHFKSLSDLKSVISSLEKMIVTQNQGRLLTRPTKEGKHPTIYPEQEKGRFRTVMGVRICDYKFSDDEHWVLPDDQWGLSFSATWIDLQDVYLMFTRNRGKSSKPKKADIYWVLQGSYLPKHMMFVQDRAPGKEGHYFLTVTKKMKISTLVDNLKWIAGKMSVIKDGSIGL